MTRRRQPAGPMVSPAVTVSIIMTLLSAVSAEPVVLTIIHYEMSSAANGSTGSPAALMHTLQHVLEAYPGALLLNPTGHLGKRLWIQHDATAPNLADLLRRKEARPLTARSDPLLAANVRMPGRAHVRPSTVVSPAGAGRVGLVGFVSETQAEQPEAVAQMVHVTAPEAAVQREAQRLKGNSVPLVLALGNAGYPEDEAVAASVKEVDAVVASHGGDDGYPLAIQQADGKVVPLLRAPPGTVCIAQLMFSEDGLVDWAGFTVPIKEPAEDG